MPCVLSSRTPRDAAEQLQGRQNQPDHQWERWGVRRLYARALGEGDDSTSRSLIIVGITCGTIAALVLVGILVYLVIRHRRRHQTRHQKRHRHSVPASSTIRNGYNRARADTDSSRRTRSTKKRSTGESKGYLDNTLNGYAHVPMVDVTLTGSPPAHIDIGYRYDPSSARGLPRPKESKKEPGRLKLNTSFLAPSPKLDIPQTNPNRPSTLLMQSATTPPPFAQYFPVGQPIRPRAELRVGNSPVDDRASSNRPDGASGVSGLGSFVPPAPPSWASFWPTESGWTGPGGPASIRDEDFGSDSDGSFVLEDEKRPSITVDDDSDDDTEGGQYALDTRPEDHTFGRLRLTPKVLQGPGRTSMDRETTNEPDNVSVFLPASPQPVQRSPRLDLGVDLAELPDDESTRLTPDHQSLVRGATGKFTLAFGPTRSNTNVTQSGSGRVTRSSTGRTEGTGSGSAGTRRSSARSKGSSGRLGRSGTRVTRSSTTRTDRTDLTEDTVVSTVSGQILSALSGQIATPLIRSMDSLRRVGGFFARAGESAEGSANAVENAGATPEPAESSSLLSHQSFPGLPAQSTTVRRLPPLPSPPPPVPPVPPIPRHHAAAPAGIRPLPIPNSPPQSPHAAYMSPQLSIPRTTSLNLGRAPPNRPAHLSTLERSASAGTPMAVRPLPAPPVPTQ